MTCCTVEVRITRPANELRAPVAVAAGLFALMMASALLLPGTARAVIQHVQSNYWSPHSEQSSVEVEYSYPQLVGSLNVVIVAFNNSTSNVQSVTDTRGNTYTLAVGPTMLADFGKLYIYYAKNIVAAGGAENIVTVVLDAVTPYPDVRIAEYSGIDTANPFEAGVGSTGTNGLTTNSGSLTTTNPNDLLVAGNFVEVHTIEAGANYTGRVVSYDGHILEDRIVSSVGSYNATTTVSESGRWIMQLAAFKAASGGEDTQAPTAPSNLNAAAVSSAQIDLSWTASTDNVGVTGYLVERCQGSGCANFSQIATPTAPSYSDTGRSPSTSYSYRVRAQDAVPNYSGYSSTASASTPVGADTQAPTTPTNLSAAAVSSTQINLSWIASTDDVAVTGYLVERCQGAGCSNFSEIATPTTTTYNDIGRTPSTSYSYRVRARDAVPNYSDYSNTASATAFAPPDNQAPTTPTGLTANAVSSSQVSLSWTASTDNFDVTGYRVERCTGTGCSDFTQVATPVTTSYSDSDLSASTSYSYRVRATDAAGNLSTYSNTVSATTQASAENVPPTAPSLGVEPVSTEQISLNWTASTDNVGVTGYLVERCQGLSCSNFTQIATVTTTFYDDTGLSPSTDYNYRVRARDAVPNYSDYSNTASATTFWVPDNQAPTAPTSLTAIAVSSSQVNLSWTGSTDNVDVTGYLVERCQGVGCSNFTQITLSLTTSYNDAGLSLLTSYSYRVRARDAEPNYSDYSNTASATTVADNQAPTAPTGLTANAVSSGQVNLSWTASTDNVGVTGYRIERCTGTGCSDFTQVATAATTSYNNTGLSASTSYSYRVRAADAASNLSGYSGTASGTTPANTGSVLITYTYDAAGRVSSAVSSSGRRIDYQYDANGNITVIERQ